MSKEKSGSFKPSEWTPKTISFEPFRFWCQMAMPAVYDDSLGFYELLCKLVAQLNDVMGQTEGSFNDMTDRIQTFTRELTDEQNQFEMSVEQDQDEFKGELQRRQDEFETDIREVTQDYINRYEALKSYVEHYFDNLDVQEEINNKLNKMAADGSLTALLNPLVPPIVQKWLSDNIASGSYPYVLDKSLTQEGAAADAKKVGELLNKRAYAILSFHNQNKCEYDVSNLTVKLPNGYIAFDDTYHLLTQTTLNLNDKPEPNKAWTLYLSLTNYSIYFEKWSELNANNDPIIGSVFKNHIYINGLHDSDIVIINDTSIYYDSAYIVTNNEKLTYNSENNTLLIPKGWTAYRSGVYVRSNTTVNLAEKEESVAYKLYFNPNENKYYSTPWNRYNNNNDPLIGVCYGESIYINGVSSDQIIVNGYIKQTINIGYFHTNEKVTVIGTTIHIPTGDITDKYGVHHINELDIVWKNGFICFENNEIIISNDIKNNTIIGCIKNNHIFINGVYNIQIFDENEVQHYDHVQLALNQNQYITYNKINKTLHIPQAYLIYKNKSKATSNVSINLNDIETTYDAYNLYFNFNTNSVYAIPWNNYNNNDDTLIGYIFRNNIEIGNISRKTIKIISKTMYCFGDSITAGVGSTKQYHQYAGENTQNQFQFKNYGIGTTGFIRTTSDTVIVGNGNIGIGVSQKENGNNNIIKEMEKHNDFEYCTIFSGVNDYLIQAPLDEFRNAVSEALQYAKSITLNIFCMTPLNTNIKRGTIPLSDYVDIIIEECKKESIILIDLFHESFLNPDSVNYFIDGLHPKNDGQKRIGFIYNSILEKYEYPYS